MSVSSARRSTGPQVSSVLSSKQSTLPNSRCSTDFVERRNTFITRSLQPTTCQAMCWALQEQSWVKQGVCLQWIRLASHCYHRAQAFLRDVGNRCLGWREEQTPTLRKHENKHFHLVYAGLWTKTCTTLSPSVNSHDNPVWWFRSLPKATASIWIQLIQVF